MHSQAGPASTWGWGEVQEQLPPAISSGSIANAAPRARASTSHGGGPSTPSLPQRAQTSDGQQRRKRKPLERMNASKGKPRGLNPDAVPAGATDKSLPACYRRALYIGDDVRQCYNFHPEVPRKQGEFVGEDVMTSITPHGVVNNSHGHVMPHGRSCKTRGGSREWQTGTVCQLCERMKDQVAVLRGTHLPPPQLDMSRPPQLGKGNGWTPLCFAASEGQVDQIHAFLHGGSNVNEETKFGDTPILVAAAEVVLHAFAPSTTR